MKIKNLLALILIIVFFAVLSAAVYYFILLPKISQNRSSGISADNLFGWKFPVTKFPEVGPVSNQVAYSSIRDPGGIPAGLPVRLQIPIIGVNSAVEDALITKDGRMDVPAGSVNVAWFALGPHPGQRGSAVIGGHFGINGNVSFVFYRLNELKVGDKVYILNDKGDTLAFQVRSIKSFDRNADATTVFTSDDGLAHLNLITCEGIWNQVNGNYPQRLVVFADSIPSEGAAPVAVIPSRSLSIGSKGGDVIALQTALEQKGFLIMPSGVAKGTFGGLTRTAVSKYQTSVGLPSVGVFGPLTRTKLMPAITTVAVLPSAGTDDIIPSKSPDKVTFFQIFIQLLQSLYATLIDGIITTCLFVAIAFVLFKIVARLYYSK